MKKTLTRIATITALFMFAPYLGASWLKAEPILAVDTDSTTTTTDSFETRGGVVIQSVYLLPNLVVYLVQDAQTGLVYSYYSTGALPLNVNDLVSYTLETTAKGKILIRDIIRR